MWTVICIPEGVNDNDRNEAGLVVALVDTEDAVANAFEVSRVAFARRHSRNPVTLFCDQLDIELTKAYGAATKLNELAEELELLRDDTANKARERLREILGEPDGTLV